MPTKSFDLEMRTEDFALAIIGLYRELPQGDVGRVLGRQILRSGTSIGANHHEAARARSSAEFVAKMGDSLKAANEAAYRLRHIGRARLADTDRIAPVQTECGETHRHFHREHRHRKAQPRLTPAFI